MPHTPTMMPTQAQAMATETVDLAPETKASQMSFQAHAADGPQLGHDDGDHDGPEGAEDDRFAAPDEHIQQEGDGDKQMAPLPHDLAGLGHLLLG